MDPHFLNPSWLTMALVAVVGWFIRRSVAQVERSLEKLNKQIGRYGERLARVEADLDHMLRRPRRPADAPVRRR